MNAPGIIAQAVFHFFLSFLLAYILFRENRKSPNPLKWTKTDLVLLLIALFYFMSGMIPLFTMNLFSTLSVGHSTSGIWRRSFHSVASTGGYWILLLGLSLWFQREPPKHRNPLEWGTVDRTLLLVWVFLFVGGVERLESNLFSSVASGTWINQNFATSLRPVYMGEGVFVLLLLLTGLWLRRYKPETRIFAHVVIQYAALSIAFNAYVYGALTNPNAFLAGMALGASTLLLFRPSIALPGVGTFMVTTVGTTVLSGSGLIPYSPIYSSFPVQEGRIASSYMVSSLTWTSIVFLIVISLMTLILVRWRNREAKLSEMSEILRKMFGRYLSTEVMNALIEDPASLEMGGERRRVTIMMTDLRGFTALSERMEPEQVVQMLNSYFEVMVDIILEYGGTINEIIGDALLVVFGAPQEIEDRAQRAIACAIAMQNAMKEVNVHNREQGLPDIEMGIGLNESEVIVGNIGSSKRSKYAVVGSGVNMASRIESYTVGGQVLISESVRKEAGDILRIDAQRDITPKGAGSPLRIYEVGGISGHYDLVLQSEDPIPVPLLYPVPLMYTTLDGKKIEKNGIGGAMVRLSEKGAVIQMTSRLEPMTNIKLNLQATPNKLKSLDFYGKVIDCVKNEEWLHHVRFTAVPMEVDAYFQALLQYGTNTDSIESV